MDGLKRDKKARSSPAPAALNPTDEFKLQADRSRGARALAPGSLLADYSL